MVNIVIDFSDSRVSIKQRKIKNSSITYLGHIWDLDNQLPLLESTKCIDGWADAVNKLTGFYSLVKIDGNSLFATVDHIRSRPLFYSKTKESFYLSSSAEWVRAEVHDHIIDEKAKEEFQMLGYVLGSKTLYPLVKQLQAGECLTVINGELNVKQYYTFKHIEPLCFDRNNFFDKLESATRNSIKRLIDYADGRQIVVPLSGGYDSRLIVSALRNLKYKNVICFSYGVPGNKESNYSREIARKLSYEWLFIEYTDSFWKEAWASKDAADFRDFSSNHTSLPHVQDWLALNKLKDNPAIDSNAVFVPGHCCVTGYIPADIYSNKVCSNSYAENIIKTHFTGRPFSLNNVLDAQKIKDELIRSEEFFNIYDIASSIMKFNWQERQAKYITNSVRAYECFSFDWWLPLWDQEFMRFWENAPLEGRLNRSLYIDYVNKCFLEAGSNNGSVVLNNSSVNLKFYKFLKSLLVRYLPGDLYSYLKVKHNKIKYKNHSLKFESLLPENKVFTYLDDGYSIIGVYSDLFLKGEWGDNI